MTLRQAHEPAQRPTALALLHALGAFCVALAVLLSGCGSGDVSPVPAPAPAPAPAPTPVATPTPQSWSATKQPCTLPGTFGNCTVPGFESRPYRVYVPSKAVLSTPQPVVVMFHGGTGNALSGVQVSCPPASNGAADPRGANCLHNVAEREGFIAVYPNGTGSASDPESRTFNAGGGSDGWQCVGGTNCEARVDEEAYVAAVLDDLNAWLHVDRGATFATGLSNGAALAHKLACTMAPRFAAIASVGGGNQFATTTTCQPSQQVAILQIHGEADACWTYAQTATTCAAGEFGRKVGAEESAAGWAARNGCTAGPQSIAEADSNGDGRRTVALTWSGCRAPVVLLRVEGAGHTWPSGLQYGPESVIGPVSREWGTERIWAFFNAQRRAR